MADTKISGLPAATTLAGTEIIPGVQTGVDVGLTPAQLSAYANLHLPVPTSSVLGGVKSAAVVAHQFQTGISVAGAPTFAQPAFTDLTGAATTAQGGSRLLKIGSLISANFNIATDQQINLTGSTFTVVAGVIITNASTSLTTAKGAFYSAASKTGVMWGGSATSLYTGLTSAASTGLIGFGGASQIAPTSVGMTVSFNATGSIFFSLTTTQGAAATADIYVYGYDLT